MPGFSRLLPLFGRWEARWRTPIKLCIFPSLESSPVTIGLLVAYGTAVTIFATLVGGYLADALGRRRVVIVFSWVSVLSAFMYFVINSASLIIIPLTIASIASLYTPAFNSIMMDSINSQDRVRGFSVFNAINTFPSVFAPTFGGILMTFLGVHEGIRYAYLGSALFGVIAVTIRSKRLQETYVVSRESTATRSPWFYIKRSFVEGIASIRERHRS